MLKIHGFDVIFQYFPLFFIKLDSIPKHAGFTYYKLISAEIHTVWVTDFVRKHLEWPDHRQQL